MQADRLLPEERPGKNSRAKPVLSPAEGTQSRKGRVRPVNRRNHPQMTPMAADRRSHAESSATAKNTQSSTRPIWEVLVELGASVPVSEWEKVPTDLSVNFHHYHHGAPKETE
jgi:hypothetical protein